MKNKIIKIVLILNFIVILSQQFAEAKIEKNNELIFYINQHYYFEKEFLHNKSLGSVDSIIKNLDKYSEYYSPDKVDNTQVNDNYFSKEIFNFGYIKFTNFLDGTDGKFITALTEFKEKNVSTLILDLSFCDGGDLDSAINIAKQLVPKGKICEIKLKNETKTYYSELDKCPFENIIIITSPKTASASEILISALKESNCAFVVGTNTYGKTAVQRNFVLSNGGVLKLTVGKYYTGNGIDIEGSGIKPDINIMYCIITLVCFALVFIVIKIRLSKKEKE